MSLNSRREVSHRIPPLVVILGGDPIVGQALEGVARAAGYNARFLAEPFIDKPSERLADAQLLLLAPELSAESRQAFLTSRISGPLAGEIPVLELVTVLDGRQPRQGHQVLWPCRAQQLKRRLILPCSDAPVVAKI